MFEAARELRIGPIVEVSGDALRIELDAGLNELARVHHGRTYPIGQVGSVIKILWGRRVLLAYVRLLRMRSEIPELDAPRTVGPSDDARVLEANLFAEGQWSLAENGRFRFSRGVRRYPMPRQDAYLVTHEELESIFRGAENRDGTKEVSASVEIGHYVGTNQSPCHANLDKLFGLHGAVLGSTGSGKSGTVAAILHSLLEVPKPEEAQKFSPRVIVLDPHGEYSAAFKDDAVVLRPVEDSGQPMVRPLRLPYWLMSGEELRDLFIGKTEYEATSENNIVLKALRHARLVRKGWVEAAHEWTTEQHNGQTDVIPDEPRIVDGHGAEVAGYNRDQPDPFSLDEFEHHIKWEQGIRISSKKWAPMSASDFKPYGKVLDKLRFLRTDSRLAFLMTEAQDGVVDLPDVLQQFVGTTGEEGEDRPLRIIDMSALPNEVAGPLTATLARLLFQYKIHQTREEREKDPIVLVCEEAHRYVPDSGRAAYGSAQEAIRRIAKEGRKYGIGLLLVSQRPADVDRTVLSQCNSWLILRLTNSADQDHVRRFLPDSLSGLTALLPALGRREALFVGEAAAFPSRIEIRELNDDQLPDAHDIAFVQGWKGPPTELEELQKVVRRWRREDEHEPPS